MKAVGFDLVGTLCSAGTREDDCVRELCLELSRGAVSVPCQEFLQAYNRAALEYLEIRKTTHREVSNRVWIAEALETLGMNLEKDDEVVRRAVDAYFRPYVARIHVPKYVAPILSDIRRSFKIGLITNFTHAPAVRDILQKNDLAKSFDSIVISDEVGWRKPHPNIFQKFLDDVSVDPLETFFVGDDLRYDITGAKTIGMRTILLQSEDTKFSESYYTTLKKPDSARPDVILKSLYEVRDYLLSTEI
jgi:putative hydrolase of the HAD superfamily